ncbi:DUF6876 family protein [Leptolyngbya iicbica]|uniref:DUF6876 family protein n=1 Tax=Leptolyngbya iicbica TaxID=3161580 RepID=UPI000585512B|nr:DUF6876 family protein [Leptolyngbya sp. LK]
MEDAGYSLSEGELSQFTGTSQYYQHPLGVLITDGVHYMAERGRAYWLIDVIAIWQLHPRIYQDPMLQQIQFWTLTVNDDRSAQLICERDSEDIVVTQRIPFTDFPLKKLRLYFQDGVILLPSEY